MSYFQYFPTIMYDPVGNGDNAKLVTNILQRVRMRANMKKNVIMLDQYDIKENETFNFSSTHVNQKCITNF